MLAFNDTLAPTTNTDRLPSAPWQLNTLWQLQQLFRPEREAWITLINQNWHPRASTCQFFALPQHYWLRARLDNGQQLEDLIRSGSHQLIIVPADLLSPWPWSHWQRLCLRHRCQMLCSHD